MVCILGAEKWSKSKMITAQPLRMNHRAQHPRKKMCIKTVRTRVREPARFRKIILSKSHRQLSPNFQHEKSPDVTQTNTAKPHCAHHPMDHWAHHVTLWNNTALLHLSSKISKVLLINIIFKKFQVSLVYPSVCYALCDPWTPRHYLESDISLGSTTVVFIPLFITSRKRIWN